MNIFDFLMQYRKPLFNADLGGAGGGDGGAAPASSPDAAGAPADGGGGAGSGEGDPAPQSEKSTLLGSKPEGDDAAADGDKPDGEKPDGDKDADGDKGDKGEGDNAPFAIAAPEGMENFQGEFDKFATEASTWMTDNPDATVAQAFQWAAERQAAAASAHANAMSESYSRQIQNWESEVGKLPGFEGDKRDEALSIADKAIAAYGDDDLRAVLTESGLGSNPHLVKFAYKIGQDLKDSPVLKSSAQAAEMSLADALYNKK